MTGLAISLVLAAALIHASWNYILKKSVGVVVVQHFQLSGQALAYLLASAVLHTAYYLLLDRGYRYGDLSVVYPLARATGPCLTVVVALVALGERPGIVALCGAALV